MARAAPRRLATTHAGREEAMARAAPRRLATTHAGREEAVGVEVRARDARLGDHAVERGLLQPHGLGLGSG